MNNKSLEALLIPPKISISIVSHLQIKMASSLLKDIREYCRDFSFEVILTLNVHESLDFLESDFSFPIFIFENNKPQGFGENHNQAFKTARGEYFCVMNPDIRLNGNPFDTLLVSFSDATIGVTAPVVLNARGGIEDNARYFPSPFKILCKLFGGCKGSDYLIAESLVFADWVAGMFMLFPRTVFAQLHGFDETYFLYYEDVDLCGRLTIAGWRVAVCPASRVVHHAQRSSHRSLTYLRWHLTSMLRFFLSPVYRQLSRRLT